MCAKDGKPNRWTNTSGVGQWLSLGEGTRQFLEPNQSIELEPDLVQLMWRQQLEKQQAQAVFAREREAANAAYQNSIWYNVKMGMMQKVEALLKASDDPQELISSRDEQGHTVTHWAAKRGDLDMLIFLAERGAPLFSNSNDRVGMTPLHWACTEGRLEVVRYLLDKGANVNCVDKAGCTPLLIAAQYGMADVVAFLVKMHSDTAILDKHRDSAMHWAAYKGELEIVGLLKYLGLPVDDPDSFGQTPLHLAALRGNYAVVEFLVMDCDVPIDGRDHKDKTPLELAERKGHHDVQKFLISREKMAEPLLAGGVTTVVRKLCSSQTLWRLLMGDGRTMEGVRWPILLVFTNTALEHFFYLTYFLADGGLSDYDGLHAFSMLAHTILWLTFFGAWCTDAGSLDSNSHNGLLGRAYENYFDELVHPTQPTTASDSATKPPVRKRLTLCHTCQIARPERAKHCRTCRKCVTHFDHHCPYVGNCVGRNNYPWFFGYAFTFLICCSTWQITAFLYLRTVQWDWSVFICMLYFFPFWIFAVILTSYHAQLTMANLTTNEQSNVFKYDYLREKDGLNVYDRGLLNNVVSRCLPGPVDTTVMQIQDRMMGV